MIDRVFGIKVRISGLSINRYRPIIGRLLSADYQSADNRPLPYRCISSVVFYSWTVIWAAHRFGRRDFCYMSLGSLSVLRFFLQWV